MDEQEQPDNPDSFNTVNDLFQTFFSDQQKHDDPRRGADIHYDLTITFEEAILGCQKDIELPRWETCSLCKGSGGQSGTSPSLCSPCEGTGEIRRIQPSTFGEFVNTTVCQKCQGEGYVITTPCEKCRGQGRQVYNYRHVEVNIPAGVDNNINVRVKDEGHTGKRGGAPGNLYIVLTMKPHPVFKRRGNDILCELPISFAQAALGDEIEMPTVDGKTTQLEIPAGTQTNHSFIIKERGAPVIDSSDRGDMYVIVKVVTPTQLTPEEQELLTQFDRKVKLRINKLL